jgi:hypothetical protein
MPVFIILGFFAAIWWVGGVQFGHAPIGLAVVGPVISILLIVVARGRLKGQPARPPADKKRIGRVVALASSGEGVAMAVAGNVLLNLHALEYLFPVMAVIVGLHFLPLAKWIPAPMYYVASLLLVLIGLGGLALHGDHRPLAVGLMSAMVLWGAGLAVLTKSETRSVAA